MTGTSTRTLEFLTSTNTLQFTYHGILRPMTVTKSQKTRARILDSAARVLAEQGYVNTRLDDIAAAAGIKTGSLYYHFSSREQLIEEVLKVAIERVSDAVKARIRELPKGASYRERIGAAIETQLVMALQQDVYTAASFRATPSLPPQLRESQIAMQRKFGAFWRDLLAKAMKAGEIDPAFQLSVLRMQLLGSINWSIEWYRPGSMSSVDIAAQLTAMLFDGVSPRVQRAAREDGTAHAKKPSRSLAGSPAVNGTRRARMAGKASRASAPAR